MLGQRNTLVFALIVMRLWELFRLPKQRLHWCDIAKGVEWCLYLANSGALLGLWTCWVQRHIVGLYWVPGLAGVRGNEIADKFARDGSVQKFVGPEPSLGIWTENIRRGIKCWMYNQHLAIWRCLSSTQRQARKLISGPISTTKTRFLSFNRIQSKDIISWENIFT